MPERPQFELERDTQKRVARDLLDQKTASSRPGQVYHTMTSLQDRMARPGYTPAQADTDQLKAIRRDWNRNQKYTPQGMRVSGVTTPMGAQDAFRHDTEAFRQLNKPAYNKMYPLTGGFMDVAEKGGLWGMLLREIAGKAIKKGRDYMSGTGLAQLLADDTEEDKADYIAKTFGPYPTDIHPGLPVEDDRFIAPPDDIIQTDPSADIIETSNLPIDPMPTPDYGDLEYFDWIHRYGDDYLPSGEHKDGEITRTIPGRPITPLQEEVVVPEEPLPFDDSGRETGIASLYGQGPQWGETGRPLEEEYKNYLREMGEPSTYEEFLRNWRRKYERRPHEGEIYQSPFGS